MGVWRAQSSFTGGIISEKMFGRVELENYNDSVADIQNFLVQPHGGITRRGGTKYCWEVKDSSKAVRLIPFEYSADVSYVIEAGDEYFRFGKEGSRIESGGSPVELSTPYAEADLFELKFVQNADVMWIVHKDYKPRKLLRYSDTEWYLDPVAFIDGPYFPVNGSPVTLIADSATGTVTVTAANGAAVSNAESGTGGLVKITTDVRHGLVSGDDVTIADIVGTTEANGTNTVTVVDDFSFLLQGVTFVNAYTSGGTLAPTLFSATDVGRLLRIWHESDAKWAWGDIVAYNSTSSVDVTVVENNFPIIAPGGATTKWRLGKFSDTTGWPSSVMLYEVRLAYAGAPFSLQDLDFSQTDLFGWFQIAADEDLLASDAIGWSLLSPQIDDICWMLPGRGGLAVGTTGGAWIVTGANGKDDPLTATGSVSAKKHTAVSSDKHMTPVALDNAVIFLDKAQRSLHEFAYVWEEDTYRAPDLTVLADHLTRATQVVDMDVEGPQKLVWVVLASGEIICLTYMRAEKVVAWHRHVTDGSFESVACVTEGRREVPYFIVNRTIDGGTVRYVEYMEEFFRGPDIEDAYFVDCGISTTLSPASTTVTGLDHLEGETVVALVDGKVATNLTVSGGQITLPTAGEVVHVGLNFNSDVKSLPIELANIKSGSTIGRVKEIGTIAMRVTESYGAKVGQDFDNLEEVIFNEAVTFGEAPTLFSGEKVKDKVEGGPSTDVRICIRQDVPLPLTITSVVTDLNITES